MIISAIIGYSIAIANVIFKRRKIFSIVLIVFMWMLFGWNTDNADYTIHLNKYYDTNQSIIVEPIFSFITSFFRSFGFSYSDFLIVMSAIFLASLFILSSKLVGKYYPFLLGLYFIFPLLFNIVLFRFSIGLIFSYWGIYLLLKTEKKKIWAILLLLLGGLTHFSLLVLLVLPISKMLSTKKIFIITISVIILESFLIQGMNFTIIFTSQSNNLLIQKISYVLAQTNSFGVSKERLFQVIVFYIVFLCILYINKLLNNENEMSKVLFNMNTLILVIIPLMWINSDLYRTQIPLLLFNYSLLIINCKNNSPKKYLISNIYISFVGVFISVLFLFVYVITRSSWFTNVFVSIFTNNHLW